MTQRVQVMGGGSPYKRKNHVEWIDGFRKGKASHGHPCDQPKRCDVCTKPVTAGDVVGRQQYPKRLAHWDCLKQQREDDRTTPATCHTCGKPATGETVIRGRYRPVCQAHDP